MCDVCRMHFCPPRCPEYTGKRAGRSEPIGSCAVCESLVYQGDSCFSDGEKTVCADCAEYMDINELNALCGFDGNGELLGALGFDREIKE